jgi:flagellar protein FliO/FliZ
MVMLVIRLVFSLALIAGVLFLAMRVAKKRQGISGDGALEVIARQALTRTTSVAVVRVGDRAFVLGSGESQVTLIGETSLDDLAAYAPAPTVSGAPAGGAGGGAVAGSLLDKAVWSSALDGLRQLTARR